MRFVILDSQILARRSHVYRFVAKGLGLSVGDLATALQQASRNRLWCDVAKSASPWDTSVVQRGWDIDSLSAGAPGKAY